MNNLSVTQNPFLKLVNHPLMVNGSLGAVAARAGVGKTSFLAHLSILNLLSFKHVLHVSMNAPVQKVSLCYEDTYRNMASMFDMPQSEKDWETILQHRFIMTFKSDDFSADKLDSRLHDLTEQNIFLPQVIIFDGIELESTPQSDIIQLKQITEQTGSHAWFSVRTHRHEQPDDHGFPPQLSKIKDLFEMIVLMHTEDNQIRIQSLKGNQLPEQTFLNASTLMPIISS